MSMYSGTRHLLKFVRPTVDDESTLNRWEEKVRRAPVDHADKNEETKGKDLKIFYENMVSETRESEIYPKDVVRKSPHKDPDDKDVSDGTELLSLNPDQIFSVSSKGKKQKKSRRELKHENLLHISYRDKSHVLPNELLKYSQNGDMKNVHRLVELGVDINFQDSFGWTALMTASCSGQKDIVFYLLMSGADASIADKKGRDAKSLAKKNHHTSILELLKSSHIPRNDTQQSTSSDVSSHQPKSVQFTCDICKSSFKESEKKHLTSTLHLFNLKMKEKRTNYFIPESNRGFQMMVKHGWNVDKGLGAEGQGRKFPVQTVLKRDRQGLGSNDSEQTKMKPKVTHFSAGDTAAIKKPSIERKMKTATLSKRLRAKKERKDKRWERNLRTYMNS